MCQQFSLTPPRHTYLSGRALLNMTQKDFVALAPEGGDTLYAQLQLWKTAFESYHQQQSGGQSSGGMTAADNSMPKNNWMAPGQTMIANDQMKGAAVFGQQYPVNDIQQQQYFGNGNMNTAQTPPSEEQRPSPFPRHSGTVHLWHFIRELLDHPNKQYGSCVRWVDRDEGTFKIESSHHLARFWGQRKNRAQMNYDKLSRSLRQYYKKGSV
ncbi:unnamed protein product [Strongylus vulgaris]|uniref:ETS domain-containing protein n=1 Tax=Strongylus vulgaris TaxID=40348 RepID=A0A3P7IG91_STRVU|nr:unnamed protein product [Strongylus vulgaris]